MSNPKLTIAIPTHNSAKTIKETIESALNQSYPLKEILIIDDDSKDDTVEICRKYPVRVMVNERNFGIGVNLSSLMSEAQGRYVVYLCSDDVFTHPMVCSDIVSIFDKCPDVGVIGRYYYQFMDGKPGAVMVERSRNILISSINPSGMAFRKQDILASNKMFIEMPTMVSRYLAKYRWTMMEYDTVAVRLHPGGNTATKEEYYIDSPIQTLTDFYGKDFKYHLGLIQLKNRAPKRLWKEIWLTVKINPKNLLDPLFYFCAITAVIVPGYILRPLSDFYRDKITRQFVSIKRRDDV
jgi:glycosyltransferase involved in cell wall biosynthesis